MTIGRIWLFANPELSDHLRRADEARAAAYYAAFRAVARVVAAPFQFLAERLRRVRQARETYHALAGLSDHSLRDIGLSRSEIRDIALGIAELPRGTDVTLADLRGVRSESSGHDDASPLPHSAAEDRRTRPTPQEAAARPAAAARLAA
jgi:uncharacterized protein YjiS (DUF1127 family)